MEEVRNLNDLLRGNNRGLYKRWVWKESNYHLACDYLQKANYSIQDINSVIKEEIYDYKSVVFLIACVDWLRVSYLMIKQSALEDVKTDFQFSQSEDLKKHEKFFSALRSFVMAHPLNTKRHQDYGLDGDFICVDLRSRDNSLAVLLLQNEDIYHLSINGMSKGGKVDEDQFLYCYSKKEDEYKYFRLIGFRLEDIVDTARLYVDAIYEFDRYLARQKKNNGGRL